MELDSKVTQVMNANPKMITEEEAKNKERLLNLMNSLKIRSIPVVDHKRVIKNIITLDELIEIESLDLPVLIMAGGRGERLRPITNTTPKPLIKVGSRTLIERIIDGLTHQKIKDVFISIHYQKELFYESLGNGKALGVNLRFIEEAIPMGTAGAITLLPGFRSLSHLLVTNADLIHNIDYRKMYQFHTKNRSDITIASTLFPVEIPYGVIELNDGKFKEIKEKPSLRFPVMCGVNLLSNRILRELVPNSNLNMVQLITLAYQLGLNINVFDIETSWVDIGDHKILNRELSYFKQTDL
jgi:NDP-sugar pyrophosphorylase family protein